MLKKISRIAACAAILAFSFGAAKADTVVVISNPGTTIAAGDVNDIFLGEKQMAGATKLTPVDNSAMQETFLAKLLGMDATKYKAAWAKKAFRDGLTAPAVKGGDADVVDFVKKTPGAVGYVKAPAPAGVNVVTQK